MKILVSAESVISEHDNINIISTTVNIEAQLESLNRLTSLSHDNFIHTDLLTDEKEIQADEFSNNCLINMLVDEKQVQVDRLRNHPDNLSADEKQVEA